MKNIFIICVALCVTQISFGQQRKIKTDYRQIIGVTKAQTNNEKLEKYGRMLNEKILDILKTSNKFNVIDLDTSARKEVLEDASRNYKAKNWIDESKTLNAEYYLTVALTNLKFIKIDDGSGYKAAVSYSIKIVNASTRTIIDNGTKTFSSEKEKLFLTPEEAFEQAVTTTEQAVSDYFKGSFPLKFAILKEKEIKGDKSVIVVIMGGANTGVQTGQIYNVYFDQDLNGMLLPEMLGQIKITTILNENYAEAKVAKGGDKIHETIISNNNVYTVLQK